MFTRKDRKIKNLKAMIKNRDGAILKLRKKLIKLDKDNRNLKLQNEKLDLFKSKVKEIMLEKTTIVNKYDKIKELVDDNQSIN